MGSLKIVLGEVVGGKNVINISAERKKRLGVRYNKTLPECTCAVQETDR